MGRVGAATGYLPVERRHRMRDGARARRGRSQRRHPAVPNASQLNGRGAGAFWALVALAAVFLAMVFVFGESPRWPIQGIPR